MLHSQRRRCRVLASAILGCAGVTQSALGGPPNSSYKLAFADEFNQASLDTDKWNYGYPWSQHGLQDNSVEEPSAVSLVDGYMSITASGTPVTYGGTTYDYTSGAINTSGKFNFTYGYIEARQEMPVAQGLWPAVWTEQPSGWPPEIDVEEVPEMTANETEDHVTYHWLASSGYASAGTTYNTGVNLSAGFHDYGVLWQPTSLTFYFDGKAIDTVTSSQAIISQLADNYLLIDMGVGGWPGNPTTTLTPANATMLTDYVHIYQLPTTTATALWHATGGGSWSTASNWSTGQAPSLQDVVSAFGQVSISTAQPVTWSGVIASGGIVFGDPNNVTANNTSYTLGGAVGSGSQVQMINSSGTAEIHAVSTCTGTQTINADVDLYNNTLIQNDMTNGTIAIKGGVSDTGSLTIAGAGTVLLSGSETYTGNTTVSGGTLVVSGNNATTGNITVNSGAALVLSGNNTATGTLTVNGGGTLQLQANAGNTVSGVANAAGNTYASGSTGLVFSGGGSVSIQLRGDSSLAFGNTATSNGTGSTTLNFDVNNLGTPGDTATNQTLTFDPLSDSGRDGGQGLVTYITTINATGGNNYTLGLGLITSEGGLTINANTANINIGSIAEAANDSTGVQFTGNDTITVTGPLYQGTNAALSVGKSGGGTLILQGTSNYTHSVTVGSGTMLLQGGQIPGYVGMNINGGTLVVNGTGAVNLANNSGAGSFNIGSASIGAVILNGGTINAVGGSPSTIVGAGAGGNGYLIVNGGYFNAGGNQAWIGASSAGTTASPFGAVVVSAGTLTTASYVQFGIVTGTNSSGAPQGELVQTGGVINETGGYLSLGNSASGGTDVVSLSGGTFTSNEVVAGYGNDTGVINLSGTATANAGSMLLGNASISTSTGIVNLDGGTLSAGTISVLGGNTFLNFNGGTLEARGSANGSGTLNFIHGLTGAYVYSGGGTINNNGNSINIAQPLLTTTTGNGVSLSGVTLTGSGYAAPPIVAVNGNGKGATAVATINSSGVITGLTITNPGVGYAGTPTLTISGGGGTATTSGSASTVANSDGALTARGVTHLFAHAA